MSGSGGGGYIPPQRATFNCETSRINVTVSSVEIDVLMKHSVGVVLYVEKNSNESLILVDGDGEILGAVLHANTSDIIDCIKNGYEYDAEITHINIPTCKVLIKKKTL